MGAEDIFISVRGDGGWSEPFSIGPVVNSNFQEWSPSLSQDGKTLFFSSNRPGGSGSFDVYQTQRQGDGWKTWSSPVGVPNINSEGRELFYLESNGFQWFTSTRDSDGYGDIKSIQTGQEPIPVVVKPQENKPVESVLCRKNR